MQFQPLSIVSLEAYFRHVESELNAFTSTIQTHVNNV